MDFFYYPTNEHPIVQKQWVFNPERHHSLQDSFEHVPLSTIIEICYNAGRFEGIEDMRRGLKDLLQIKETY